jgi:hypothetical protein
VTLTESLPNRRWEAVPLVTLRKVTLLLL